MTAKPPTIEDCFALLLSDDARARPQLALCHQTAHAQGDAATQLLCAAGMVLAISIEYADFRGLSVWAERLLAGRDASGDGSARAVRELDDRERTRVDAAMAALPWLVPLAGGHLREAQESAARLLVTLLAGGAESRSRAADEWVLFGKVLVDFYAQQSEPVTLERVAAVMQDHFRGAEVSAQWQARWWLLMCSNLAYFGNPAAAGAAHARVQALVDRQGLPGFRYELACMEMADVLKSGDLVRAERLFDEIDRLRLEVRAGRVPLGLWAQALLLVRRARYREALHKVDVLLALSADSETPRRDRGVYVVLRAHCLAALDRAPEGLAALEGERAHQSGAAGDVLDAIIRMLVAVEAMRSDCVDRDELAIEAIRRCAAIGFDRFLQHLPAQAGQVAEIGLDRGIEVDFLRATICRRGLLPSDPTRQDWPWRLHVHVLGELQLARDGATVHTAGKAQRKPLELLALLAAHGGGPMAVDAVIDQLWPSLAANAPRASFDMAVSRLRKLLEVPDAIRIAEGAIGLDPGLVWTDVAAFDRVWELLTVLGQDDLAPAVATQRTQAAALADRALTLYRDRLLGSDEATGLLHAARERLAIKFARVVTDHGARLESAGEWRAAAVLYERGLAGDTLAEPIYRALMRAYLKLGERAEALRTFRRCRQSLGAMLGTQPAEQTQALAREAADGG